MELTPRKQAVLEAVVKAYIRTGEPIGSKSLATLLENPPSPATLRNEMNELCSMGLLDQPHTSAGRIPTSAGYRFYVESLMKGGSITKQTKQLIDRAFSSCGAEASEIPRSACKALSSLTGLPSVLLYTAGEGVTLRAVKTISLGKRTAALLMITSDGRTDSRICALPENADRDTVSRFTELVRQRLLYRPLTEFGKSQLQSVTALSGKDMFLFLPLLYELFDMAQSAGRSTADIIGASRLYSFCGDAAASRITAMVREVYPFDEIFKGDAEKAQVVFGSDTPYVELHGKAFVTAPYTVQGRYCGRIGVLGTDRMSYDEIIPAIEYAAEKTGQLMTAAVKNMED